jgi:hypothetical protein
MEAAWGERVKIDHVHVVLVLGVLWAERSALIKIDRS